MEDYPIILDSKHIAEILGVSRRFAYKVMDEPSFPLIKIAGTKRVNRDSFFKWLESQTRKEA
ncbi:MAG: helix-turn-helix domain-containing protein [Bacillota bacterium]